MSVSGIEKGIFTCYEVKSCMEDIYSGNGLNFLGEKNYLVMAIDCYKKFLPDYRSKKFMNYLHEQYPESSDYFGLTSPTPEVVGFPAPKFCKSSGTCGQNNRRRI